MILAAVAALAQAISHIYLIGTPMSDGIYVIISIVHTVVG